MKRHLLIALLGTMVASCSDATSPTTEREMDSLGLIMTRQRWRAHNFHNYQFTLGYDCFCVANHALSVLVLRDTIYSVTDVTTGQAISRTRGMTIEDLFEVIERGLENDVPVEASFDPELGYPRTIAYNRPGMAYDAGASYGAQDLRTGIFLVATP